MTSKNILNSPLKLALKIDASLLVTTPSAITTVALLCATSSALRLPLCLLRSFFACGLCCAFLIVHSSRLQKQERRETRENVAGVGALLIWAAVTFDPSKARGDHRSRKSGSSSKRTSVRRTA